MVSADYHLFSLHDPTCEEIQNFGIARMAASAHNVGWATNAAMVDVVSDLVFIAVDVEVYDRPPQSDYSADLIREGELAFPGGQLSLPHSVDDRFLRGLGLVSGPGTYRVRISGYGRTRAREIWNSRIGSPEAHSAAIKALRGVEHYRIQMWQVATEPQWFEEDDE